MELPSQIFFTCLIILLADLSLYALVANMFNGNLRKVVDIIYGTIAIVAGIGIGFGALFGVWGLPLFLQ